MKRELPPVGTVLVGHFKGQQVTSIIVEAAGFPRGRAVKVGDRLFKSLSAAAEAVTRRCTNGWHFWRC